MTTLNLSTSGKDFVFVDVYCSSFSLAFKDASEAFA
jgi:hypothetical protein